MDKKKAIHNLYKLRVKAGFPGIIVSLVLSRPSWLSLAAGTGLSLIGLLVRAWACGHLEKNSRLTTSGPYRYTRNPLYLANTIIGLSVVVGAQSVWVLLIVLIYFLIFHPVIIYREKERMRSNFPREYEEYAGQVPLFLPRLKPAPGTEKKKFSWKLYQKNNELRALWGGLLFWSAMALKMILFQHFL